jgi:hypothetical protein
MNRWWNGDINTYCVSVEIPICATFLQLCMFILADMEVSESDEEHLNHMGM